MPDPMAVTMNCFVFGDVSLSDARCVRPLVVVDFGCAGSRCMLEYIIGSNDYVRIVVVGFYDDRD